MSSKVLSLGVADSSAEQRVRLEGVSWQQYESLISTLGDSFPALRMSYLNGTLEIMTNSPLHEKLKKVIGMLIEAFLLETRTRFAAIGSATFREAAKQRGLEPDECYCIGEEKAFPDLAVEVVLSSGVVDKLEIYRGLGVTEVWVWEAGEFAIYHLRQSGYERLQTSELLPSCDIPLLASFINPDQQFEAVMTYRDTLKQRLSL
ncbi:MAG: Uma2 family endonuclease [Cyanobacteria bacterium P01_D01_bin.1]